MTRYTDRHLEFLRDGYPAMKIPELADAFNRFFGTTKTPGQIKSCLSNHKIKCGRLTGSQTGTYLSYTREQAEFLRENYIILSISDLTVEFNDRFPENKKSAQQIRCFTTNHRVKSGRTGCFEKGHSPWNTGTKGLTGVNKTTFKKGNNPPNRKPLGSERICSKDGYILIKVAERDPHTGFPTRYRLRHVVIWEEANGPVPPGMIVAFRDGNNQKCTIENLMLISRRELLSLNQHNYKEMPDELKPSVRAVAKLEVKLKTRIFRM